MQKIGVEPPEQITRVNEYIPEIIKFIDKIIENGYAYESNGSVYFDTKKYQEKHIYPKLKPNAGKVYDAVEGVTDNQFVKEKRNP